MNLIWLLGILGGCAFAWAAVPAAIATVRTGRSIGTPLSIIIAILLGTVLMYGYLLLTYGFDWILAVNYSVEFVSWAVLLWYHFWPRAGKA